MTQNLSAQAFEELLALSPDFLTVLDESGVVQYQNPAVEDHLGYSPEDLIGEAVFDYIHPEDRQTVAGIFFETVDSPEDDSTNNIELRFQHADESWVWLEAQMMNKKTTEIGGYVVSSRNITERKHREETLKRLHEATRDLMAATTINEVATIASETATEVLDLPMNAINLYDPEQEALVPLLGPTEPEQYWVTRPHRFL